MIECWINDRCPLSNGHIIRILYGYEDRTVGFRVTRLYNLTERSSFASWEDNRRRNLSNPIIGMVSDIEYGATNTTSFHLNTIREGLPPFNTDGGPLTKTFISSRISGLEEERLQSALGICEVNSQPIYWEGFPSESRPPQDVMIDRLGECHMYVGIFGVEYSEPTILEYTKAEELERQRLCFVKDINGRQQQLTTFLEEIRDDVVYRQFSSSGELKVLVRDAVNNAIKYLFE